MATSMASSDHASVEAGSAPTRTRGETDSGVTGIVARFSGNNSPRELPIQRVTSALSCVPVVGESPVAESDTSTAVAPAGSARDPGADVASSRASAAGAITVESEETSPASAALSAPTTVTGTSPNVSACVAAMAADRTPRTLRSESIGTRSDAPPTNGSREKLVRTSPPVMSRCESVANRWRLPI